MLIILGGLIATWVLGMIQGYLIGKDRKITKSEAAKVMAKASWKPETRLYRKIVKAVVKEEDAGFFRTVNK